MLSVPDKTLALSHIRTETSAGYLYNTSAKGTTKTSQRQGRTPKTQKGLQMAESLGEVFPGARPQSSIADRRNIQLARVRTQIPRVWGRLVTFRPRVSWFSSSECWLMRPCVVLVLRVAPTSLAASCSRHHIFIFTTCFVRYLIVSLPKMPWTSSSGRR
jgi:hypothetical protein